MDQEKVELIESYIKISTGVYEWDANHGELIRCKDCAYAIYTERMKPGCVVCTRPFSEMWQVSKPNDWYCADGKRKESR